MTLDGRPVAPVDASLGLKSMELREALDQIAEIRLQMARGQVLRGYRSATAAFSGLIAVMAAGVQSLLIARPARHLTTYVGLWLGAAALCMLVVAVEMAVRLRRGNSRVQSQLTLLAVEQFMPAVVAGGLLTAALVLFAPGAAWLLPGLWMILFALGILASCRVLPRRTFLAGAFYLVAGLVAVAIGRGPAAYSPWLMGVPFAVGQFLTAWILYGSLERQRG